MQNFDIEFCKEKKMYFLQTTSVPYRDYIPPQFHCGKDGKDSYIYYSYRDPDSGKMRRIREKVNRIPIAERKKTVSLWMAEIASRLSLGWIPTKNDVPTKSSISLTDALSRFLKAKGKVSEAGTMRSYTSYSKALSSWSRIHGFRENSPVSAFGDSAAKAFMADLDENPNISPRTYNNYLRFLRLLFNWFADHGYVDRNPFTRIERKPKRLTSKTRRPLSPDEIARLYAFLRDDRPDYLIPVVLCLRCFLRPKEIVLLRCKDIDLARQTVHVSAEIAKNDRESFRTIPDDVLPFFQSIDLSHPDWFLVARHDGWIVTPGARQLCSRELARIWSNVIRPACGFSQDIQFYSLKDTGITSMLSRGVPVNIVQQQADHSSIAMTSIYVGRCSSASDIIKHTIIY